MRILALDTATSACSAAVWEDGAVRARRLERMERGQAEALMPMVGEVLAAAGTGFAEVDLFAVTVGPGAFAGLRIGLAAARAMALACGRPCLGVGTLEAIAHGVPAAERTGRALLVVLDTRRALVYAQAFADDLEPLGPPRALAPEGLAALVGGRPALLAGDAAARALAALAAAGLPAQASGAPAVADAAVVAALAAGRWRPGDTPAPPSPLYLRPPAASLPAGGGGRRRPAP